MVYTLLAKMQEILGNEEVPEYYVDSIRVAANLFSFVIELGIMGLPDAPGSENPGTRRLALVRMSPHHALAFSKLLSDHLERYQSDIGRINIPDQFMPKPPPGA
jgi:hypothetical protein